MSSNRSKEIEQLGYVRKSVRRVGRSSVISVLNRSFPSREERNRRRSFSSSFVQHSARPLEERFPRTEVMSMYFSSASRTVHGVITCGSGFVVIDTSSLPGGAMPSIHSRSNVFVSSTSPNRLINSDTNALSFFGNTASESPGS